MIFNDWCESASDIDLAQQIARVASDLAALFASEASAADPGVAQSLAAGVAEAKADMEQLVNELLARRAVAS